MEEGKVRPGASPSSRTGPGGHPVPPSLGTGPGMTSWDIHSCFNHQIWLRFITTAVDAPAGGCPHSWITALCITSPVHPFIHSFIHKHIVSTSDKHASVYSGAGRTNKSEMWHAHPQRIVRLLREWNMPTNNYNPLWKWQNPGQVKCIHSWRKGRLLLSLNQMLKVQVHP